MPNRTEMLHFRATPEEKQTIRENAGHAELALSEWMRQRSLDRLVPTQPAVGARETAIDPLSQEGRGVMREMVEHGPYVPSETYEQFMERRVGELVADDAESLAEAEAAEVAEAEWAQR